MTKIIFILFVVAGASLLLGLGFLSFRFLFGYRLAGETLHIKLFHYWTIKKLDRSEIVSVQRAPFWKTLLVPGFHLVSRMFADRVELETRSGLVLFITPKDANEILGWAKQC